MRLTRRMVPNRRIRTLHADERKGPVVRHMRRRWSCIAKNGQWVWFVNPKVAHTSLRQLMDPESRMPWHTGWRQAWNTIDFEKAILFTFVRNPWDRIVSAYHHLRQSNGTLAARFRARFDDMPFVDFVVNHLSDVGPNIERHFGPQSVSFMYDGVFYVDFICYYENLYRDWKRIARRIGLPDKIKDHYHKSSHLPYQSYYDDRSKKVVADIYAEEIEALGYEFET